MDCSPPGSSVHVLLQARILEWVVTPCDLEAPAPARGDPGSSCPSPLGPQSPAARSGRAPSWSTSEWDIRAELRLRELEEVKARAAPKRKLQPNITDVHGCKNLQQNSSKQNPTAY